jgi:tetratricopeptide (TPR) repeat protein
MHLDEADKLLAKVLDELPDFPPVFAGLAHSCILREQPRRAINLYLRSLFGYLADPDLLDADRRCFTGACSTFAQSVAVAWFHLNDEEKAKLEEHALVFAIAGRDGEPHDARAWLSLAMVELIVKADTRSALTTLTQANSRDPNNRTVLTYICVAHLLAEPMTETAIASMVSDLSLTPSELLNATRIWQALKGNTSRRETDAP